MHKKVVVIGICAMMLFTALALTSPVGAKNTKETNVYRTDWTHIQDYDFGPAEYYGENVRVVYNAINKWVQKIDGEDIWQNLKQTGTAEIYSLATGELLDIRPFECTEKVIDEGMDGGTLNGTWYNAAWSWWSADLELYDYSWKIPGVYHFWTYNIDGNLSMGYKVPSVGTTIWI